MAMEKRKPVGRKGVPKGVATRLDFKKDDTVKVISGRDKGKSGRVLRVERRTGKLLVEHVMMVKRHTRPNPSKQIKGGIAERESPIAVSNVKIVCPQCGPVRIAHHMETLPGGHLRRTRVCRKCGHSLDRK